MAFVNTMEEIDGTTTDESIRSVDGPPSSPDISKCASNVTQQQPSHHLESTDVESTKEHTGNVGTGGASDGESRRRFRLLGLKFPGTWATNESIIDLMSTAQSFHLWFERPTNKLAQAKTGGISFTFDSAEETKSAFVWAQKISIDGIPLKIQASKSFYEPDAVEVVREESDIDRKLYAIQLMPSADETLMMAVFESENISSVQLSVDKHKSDGSKMALITFVSKEKALEAKKDLNGFQIDEETLPMRLLTPAEYLYYQRWGRLKDISKRKLHASLDTTLSTSLDTPLSPDYSESSTIVDTTITASTVDAVSSTPAIDTLSTSVDTTNAIVMAPPTPPTVEPVCLAPDLTVHQVALFIEQYQEAHRTNWAELQNADELWTLLDAVSAGLPYNGLPDSLLKAALLEVLERHLTLHQSDWMQRHLKTLTREWQREMEKETTRGDHQRTTQMQMASVPYSPPPDDRPRRRKRPNGKRNLLGLMSVGPLLRQARNQYGNEEGEVDNDDSWIKTQTIDGVELSWDSWNELSEKISASAPPAPPPPTTSSSAPWIDDIAAFDNNQINIGELSTSATVHPFVAKKRKVAAKKAAGKLPQPPPPVTSLDEEAASSAERKAAELEEGEMASSADSDATSSSSSSSDGDDSSTTSSSSSSDDDRRKKQSKGTKTKSRQKRRTQREQKRVASASASAPFNITRNATLMETMKAMMSTMPNMQQSQMQMLQHMTPQQKQHMANIMRQLQQSGNLAQMNQLMMASAAFGQQPPASMMSAGTGVGGYNPYAAQHFAAK